MSNIELEDNETQEYLAELRSFSTTKEFSPGEHVRENYRYQGLKIAFREIEQYCAENHKDLGIPCECQEIVNHIVRAYYAGK